MKASYILLILAPLASFLHSGIAQTNGLPNGGWGPIDWGKSTNGVCVGLQVEPYGTNAIITNRLGLGIFLKNLTDNPMVFVVPDAASELKCMPPDAKQELRFVITDTKGALHGQMHLRKGGAKALAPLQKMPGLPSTSFEWVHLDPRELAFYRKVNLAEYFDICTPGRYQIQVDLRFQTIGDDRILSAFALPPAKTAVTRH